MLKNLGDVFSGKRFRENKIAAYAQTEPLGRFGASNLTSNETARSFAEALAMTVWILVCSTVLESKRPFMAPLARSLEADALRRLSAFMAWWAVRGYIEDARAIEQNEVGSNADGQSQAIEAAASAVFNVMYPRDVVGEAAIDAFCNGETTRAAGGSVFYPVTAIRMAIGVPPIDVANEGLESVMNDQAMLTGLFVGYRNMLESTFATFNSR